MAILGRNGYPSSRNLAKRYRPQRIDKKTGEIHWADNMRLGADNKPRNTTGCFGIRGGASMVRVASGRSPLPENADMKRAASVVVASGAPGKPRSSKKKKGIARAHDKRDKVDFTGMNLPMLKNFRADLMTCLLVGSYTGRTVINPNLSRLVDDITEYLRKIMPNNDFCDMILKDGSRRKSTIGMIESGKFSVKPIKDLGWRIKQAKAAMNRGYMEADATDRNMMGQIKHVRKPTPHQFKPEPQHVFRVGY